jgi:hypothetical protein
MFITRDARNKLLIHLVCVITHLILILIVLAVIWLAYSPGIRQQHELLTNFRRAWWEARLGSESAIRCCGSARSANQAGGRGKSTRARNWRRVPLLHGRDVGGIL